ncbi:MAG: plasmid mobilization relaxosome protein MobC [Flexilinea sp.]
MDSDKYPINIKLKTENLSAYIRKIAIDGYIINVDHTEVKNHAAQLQRIGGNINQIAKRMNQTGSLCSSDVAQVKKLLHDIWLSERQLLLKIR